MLVLEDVSSAERVYRWLAGINMVHVHPVVGWGPNTFAQHYKKYAVTIYTTWVSDNADNSTVHNYPLLVCIEQGFIGLGLLLGFFIYLFYKCQALYHRLTDPNDRLLLSCTAMVIVIMFVNNLLADLMDVDKNGSIFLMAVALIVLLDVQTQQHKTPPTNDKSIT
jgi:O-antigen ligase